MSELAKLFDRLKAEDYTRIDVPDLEGVFEAVRKARADWKRTSDWLCKRAQRACAGGNLFSKLSDAFRIRTGIVIGVPLNAGVRVEWGFPTLTRSTRIDLARSVYLQTWLLRLWDERFAGEIIRDELATEIDVPNPPETIQVRLKEDRVVFDLHTMKWVFRDGMPLFAPIMQAKIPGGRWKTFMDGVLKKHYAFQYLRKHNRANDGTLRRLYAYIRRLPDMSLKVIPLPARTRRPRRTAA